jgi:amidohydrolase
MKTALSPPVDTLIAQQMPRLVDLRHDLHAHPQLGYEETYACNRIQRELTDAQIPFEAGLAETGIVGWLVPDDPAAAALAALGLRADMDALPITEQTGLPYASRHAGLMHACGHDGHMTVLLGAARVLQAMRDRLPRPVKLIFQPAEEGGAGARRMIEDGALSDRVGPAAVGMMLGLHGMPFLPLGTLASRPGPLLAATSNFQITVRGTGGHGAMPHLVTDPLVAAAAIVTGLQMIVARNVDPTDSAVVTVAQIHGGTACNVIPASIELMGTFRTISPSTADLVARRIGQIARETATAHGCSAEVTMIPGYPTTRNDPAAYDYAMGIARTTLAAGTVHETPSPIMGGEDFSYYGEVVPSFFGFLGVRPADRRDYPGLHTPHYDFTDAALGFGVKLMVQWALQSEGAIA